MELSLAIFYYVYLIMVGVFLLFSILIIYHILRFGYMGLGSFVIVGLYVAVALAIFILSWPPISQIDWQLPIEFGTTLSINL